MLMAEQVALASHNMAPPMQGALEATTHQRIESYINSRPETRGIYHHGSLAAAADGLYVSPDVAQGRQLPQLLEMTLLPGAQLGAGNSHHGVEFGLAEVRVGDETIPTQVAIKSFTAESDKAVHEYECLIAIRRAGFQTFEPLALARDGDITYLITRRLEEIESLDNVNWTIGPADQERYNSEIVPVLKMIAETLAAMHVKGIFHGDAQPKNFIRSDTGWIGVIDPEDAYIAQTPDELVSLIGGIMDHRDGKAYADLTHFWYALVHPLDPSQPNIFLEDVPADVCMREFETKFLNPYMSALERYADPRLYKQIDPAGLRQSVYEFIERTT